MEHAKELITEIGRWFSKTIISTNGIPLDDISTIKTALTIFLSDYQRYFPDAKTIDIEQLCLYATLQNTMLYRIAHEYFLQRREDVALKYSALGRVLSGIEIYYAAEIGPSFLIHHGAGTVIAPRCRLGSHVTIYQGVTLGDKDENRPVIEDHALIYGGSRVLGKITIGKGSIIGVNSVCLHDVPAWSIAAGVPAKVLRPMTQQEIDRVMRKK